MQKLLTACSVGMVALLLFGALYFPEHSIMWLASTSTDINILRSILLVGLLGLLFTNPPRKIGFRRVLGILAVGVGAVALTRTYNNSMSILDGLVFVQAAIIFALAALEQHTMSLHGDEDQWSMQPLVGPTR